MNVNISKIMNVFSAKTYGPEELTVNGTKRSFGKFHAILLPMDENQNCLLNRKREIIPLTTVQDFIETGILNV